MTRQEAIEVIKEFVAYGEHVNAFVYKNSTAIPIEALNMAIEALEQDEIIKCKDCKHKEWFEIGNFYCCELQDKPVEVKDIDYCSWGARMESDER